MAEAFEAALGGGLGFPSSLYGIDATGANVDASGLVWEQGDADRPCLIDPTSLAPVPWRAGGAQVLGGLGEPGGGPFFADPRFVLQTVAARFEGLGLTRSARSSSSSSCSTASATTACRGSRARTAAER